MCRIGLIILLALVTLVAGVPARAQSPVVIPSIPMRDLTQPTPAAPVSADPVGLDAVNPLTVLEAAGSMLTNPTSRQAGASAQDQRPAGLSGPINILVLFTFISLAPSIMLMTTCFLRIIIVLGLLKQAIGTQQLPPPQVTISLALFMTLLVMAPTMDRINAEAIGPYQRGQIKNYDELWAKVRQPVRDFMFDQIDATGNWSAVYMVLNYRGIDTSRPEELTTANVDMISLVPAFMLSELKTGFLIGFKIYLPFLVIDMVISAILLSMGMMMLPPVLISLPFKLLLFVLVDGWQLIVGSLLQSFAARPPAATAGLDPARVLDVLVQVGQAVT